MAEMLPPEEFVRRYILGQIKEALTRVADEIPIGSVFAGEIPGRGKIVAKGLSFVLPDTPRFVQLQGLNPTLGLVIDYHLEFLRFVDQDVAEQQLPPDLFGLLVQLAPGGAVSMSTAFLPSDPLGGR